MYFIKIWLITIIVFVFCACTTWRTSDTPRTALEQLLLSSAADKAISDMNLEPLAGRSVYLDSTNLKAYDQEYVISTIREKLNAAGVRIKDTKDSAEVIVEARVGGLANDKSEIILGIPSIDVPVPSAGTVSTPELALFKVSTQRGRAKIALFAYQNNDGSHLFSSGTKYGDTFYKRYTILVIPFKRTNIPAFKKIPTD